MSPSIKGGGGDEVGLVAHRQETSQHHPTTAGQHAAVLAFEHDLFALAVQVCPIATERVTGYRWWFYNRHRRTA